MSSKAPSARITETDVTVCIKPEIAEVFHIDIHLSAIHFLVGLTPHWKYRLIGIIKSCKMSLKTAENMRQTVAAMLKGIERFNPENLPTLEEYVEIQVRENAYDLEANLAVLKLYQLDPTKYSTEITSQILLKALTNFPHTDFVLCKCLLNEKNLKEPAIGHINYLADILERCNFQQFWATVRSSPEIISPVAGFHDSIRKFVCHVVGITYQTLDAAYLAALLGGVDDQTLRLWMKKYGWTDMGNNMIFIANQEDNIKTKNITEKIDFDSVSPIMAACL